MSSDVGAGMRGISELVPHYLIRLNQLSTLLLSNSSAVYLRKFPID